MKTTTIRSSPYKILNKIYNL